MKERPILFKAEMVRALLDGRKTMTRRIVKPRKDPDIGCELAACNIAAEKPANLYRLCPYGAPEDRLWVRETWVELLHTSPATDEPIPVSNGDRLIEHATRRSDGKGWHYDGTVVCYKATSDVTFCDGHGFSAESGSADRDDLPRWKSPIHMPRKYSRIDLEIVGVRIEKLHDITEDDAKAEGIEPKEWHWVPHPLKPVSKPKFSGGWSACTHLKAFQNLWSKINGEDSWAKNPWVWVISFKRIK